MAARPLRGDFMAISIQLGSVSVDPRTLDKRPSFTDSQPATVSAQIKDACSIMQPTFILTAAAVDLVNYNYVHVQSWGRYYFIRNVITMPGSRVELQCREDVLTSNADQIKALSINLSRSSSARNARLTDSLQPSQVNRQCQTIKFKDCLLGANYSSDIVYVLTVQGGAHR